MVFSIRARLLPSWVSPDGLRPGTRLFRAPRASTRYGRGLSKYFVHHVLNLLAQPAVRWIVFRTLMPVHLNFKLLQALQRKRIEPVIKARIEHLRVMFRDGEQHVGFAHNTARGNIMLATKHDAAFAAGAIQFS